MIAENGIPVDKCPKCGMYASKDMAWKHTRYFCDSNSDGITFHQSPACNRIAELQEQVKRLERLIGEAFDAGAAHQAACMSGLIKDYPQPNKQQYMSSERVRGLV